MPEEEIPASAPGGERKSSWSRLRHLWIIGVIGYLSIVAIVGWRPIVDAAAGASPLFIGAALLVHAAALAGRALKWRFALGARQNAAAAFFLSKAGGTVTPLRAGELTPLLLSRFRKPRLTAWIIMDRLFESGATVVLGLFGVVALGAGASPTLLGGALAAGILLVALPGWLLMQSAWLERLSQRVAPETRTGRVLAFAAGVSGSARSLRSAVLWAAPFTVALTAADALGNILIYHGLSYTVPFSVAVASHLVHVLVTLFPFTPNASGVPFLAGGAFVGHYAGVPKEVLLVAVPLNYAITETLFWTCAGLGPWDLWGRRNQEPTEE